MADESRTPPRWEMQGATLGEDDLQAKSAPEYGFDQRIAWSVLDGSRHAQRSRLKQDELQRSD